MESPERSLLLLFCNIAQTVFMFAAWHRFIYAVPRGSALFDSLTVLATVGYPPQGHIIVGLQIVVDLVILVVFVAHLLSKVADRGRNVSRERIEPSTAPGKSPDHD
jgi:hypothetical protein